MRAATLTLCAVLALAAVGVRLLHQLEIGHPEAHPVLRATATRLV